MPVIGTLFCILYTNYCKYNLLPHCTITAISLCPIGGAKLIICGLLVVLGRTTVLVFVTVGEADAGLERNLGSSTLNVFFFSFRCRLCDSADVTPCDSCFCETDMLCVHVWNHACAHLFCLHHVVT